MPELVIDWTFGLVRCCSCWIALLGLGIVLTPMLEELEGDIISLLLAAAYICWNELSEFCMLLLKLLLGLGILMPPARCVCLSLRMRYLCLSDVGCFGGFADLAGISESVWSFLLFLEGSELAGL